MIRSNYSFVGGQRKQIVEIHQKLNVSGWFMYVPGLYMQKPCENTISEKFRNKNYSSNYYFFARMDIKGGGLRTFGTLNLDFRG